MKSGGRFGMESAGMHGGCRCPRPCWRVHARRCNFSAFNGYHQTASDYSGLVCTNCGHVWRSKARYVAETPDLSAAERQAWLITDSEVMKNGRNG